MRSASNMATRQGVTAMLLDVRTPPSRCARSPRRAPGPVLGQTLAAALDAHDPVEDEEDLGAGLSLLEEDGPGGIALDTTLAAALHQLRRQRGLERRLHRGHQRLGVLVAPRAVLAERLAVPVLEVGQARLVRELVVGVVDPVAWEPAGTDRARAPTRPSACRVSESVVQTRGACHWTKGRRRTRRGAGTPVRPPQVWTKRTQPSPRSGSRWMSGSWTAWKRCFTAPRLHQRRAHQPAALVAAVDDPPAPSTVMKAPQLVGEAEAVLVTQQLDVHVPRSGAAGRSG